MNSPKLKSGLFGNINKQEELNNHSNANSAVTSNNLIKKPTLTNKAIKNSQDDIANKINSATSNKTDNSKVKEAEKANVYTENQIRKVEEILFRGFCTDEIEEVICDGFTVKVGIASVSNIEYDFINQIIFQLKKENSDEKGFLDIDEKNFYSLTDGLLLAAQIDTINGEFIKTPNYDASSVIPLKEMMKNMTSQEMMGITDEKTLETLDKLKKQMIERAYSFLKFDGNLMKLLLNIKFKFNKESSELINKEPLVKK